MLENYFYFSILMISVSSFCQQHVLFSVELHQQLFLLLLMGVASIKIRMYIDINHIHIT